MRKILTVFLLVAIVAGMAFPAFGSTVKGHEEIYSIDDHAFGDYLGNAATRPDQTRPGDEVIIPLKQEGFRGENGGIITSWSTSASDLGPTVRQLKASKVVPTLHVVKGMEYIRDIELVDFKPTDRIRSQAAVRVRFKSDIYSTAEITYEFSVYLSLANSMTISTEQFGGMLRNEIYDVSRMDYVYIGDGQIAESFKDNLGLELDLGNGVSIYRDMFHGDKFYGTADIKANQKQDAILEAHPEISVVYDVHTIDVKFNGNVLEFTKLTKDSDFYYVYNIAGEYVGLSNERLPYSTRYYLSKTDIDIDPELSQHPVLSTDEETFGAALSRFIDGGKAAGSKED